MGMSVVLPENEFRANRRSCHPLHPACSMQHAACRMPHAACSMQHAAFGGEQGHQFGEAGIGRHGRGSGFETASRGGGGAECGLAPRKWLTPSTQNQNPRGAKDRGDDAGDRPLPTSHLLPHVAKVSKRRSCADVWVVSRSVAAIVTLLRNG